jgi:hypothetical protein
MKTLLLAAVAIMAAAAANAATLSVVAPKDGNKVLSKAFNLDDAGNSATGWTQQGYDAVAPKGFGHTGDTVTEIRGAVKTDKNGLFLSGPAKVTFTYLGEEAGFNNSFSIFSGSQVLFKNNKNGSAFGATATMLFAKGGFLDFGYATDGGAGAEGAIANNGVASGRPGLSIAYSALFNADRSVITLFGDDTGDSDNDDLGVRIDVTPVPLPAAGWMLLAGLGALGAAARRSRASA